MSLKLNLNKKDAEVAKKKSLACLKEKVKV